MATPPKLPKLDPEDMKWFRWATKALGDHDTEIGKLHTRATTANVQRAAVSSKASAVGAQLEELTPILPTVPAGPPKQPTAPTLETDHGTVTISWDGQVISAVGGGGTLNLQAGNVYIQRLDPSDPAGQWTSIGNAMSLAGTMVDVNVIVGNTYNYRLTAMGVDGQQSSPSDSASITVVGVDLGSLSDDLQQTLSDLQTSATTGGLIQYSASAPTDPKYQAPNSIWFDTSDPNGAVPKRWNGSAWVAVPYGEGALGPGSITASKILAGAIDTYHLGAGIVTSDKIEAGAITAELIGADAVTANSIAAGSIDADKLAVGAIDAHALSVGAFSPAGSSTNRVPRPVTDIDYWSDVFAGAIQNDGAGSASGNAGQLANATTGGISLVPNTTTNARVYVTNKLPVPQSDKLHVSGISSGTVGIQYKGFVDTNDGVGVLDPTVYSLTQDGVDITIDPTYAYYSIRVNNPAGGPSITVSQIAVFEVISSGSSAQRSELSPSGLRLFNDSGDLSVDLSTSQSNFLSIYNNGQALATIDDGGSASFTDVDVNDDVTINGYDLVDTFGDWQRMDGVLDGSLLNRLPRGIIHQATWGTMEGYTVNTQYQRIASGSFNLPADRQYQLAVDLGALQLDNSSGVNVYVELQLSMTQMTNVSDGTVFARSVVYNGDKGYFAMPPISFRTRDWQVDYGVDPTNLIIPSNVDVYWQINTNLSAAPTTAYVLHQFSNSRSMTITDIGPVIKPLVATDRSTSGAPATGGAGSGTGGSSTSKTTVKTWNASWSGSWNNGGSSRVNGSGTYTDANMLYQGLGASAMGSKFGFPSVTSTLSGKTINKVEVYLQNRWTYASSGATAHLAGHGDTSAGSSFGGTASGTSFTRTFSRGQGKWFTIADSDIPFASWKSGAVKGLALTVQGSDPAYQYYDGVNKSKPPMLRITYST